jgi:hypothetical protein
MIQREEGSLTESHIKERQDVTQRDIYERVESFRVCVRVYFAVRGEELEVACRAEADTWERGGGADEQLRYCSRQILSISSI